MALHLPKHMECRDLGHAWDRIGDLVADRNEGGVNEYHRLLSCIRCGTQRTDVFRFEDRLVRPERKKYTYAKGYIVKGGLSRAEARAFLFFPTTMRKVG